MPVTAAQKRIERKNLKKSVPLTETEKSVTKEVTVPKTKKEKDCYCLLCKQFQKHPAGYCKLLKEHRSRKQQACEEFDRR